MVLPVCFPWTDIYLSTPFFNNIRVYPIPIQVGGNPPPLQNRQGHPWRWLPTPLFIPFPPLPPPSKDILSPLPFAPPPLLSLRAYPKPPPPTPSTLSPAPPFPHEPLSPPLPVLWAIPFLLCFPFRTRRVLRKSSTVRVSPVLLVLSCSADPPPVRY